MEEKKLDLNSIIGFVLIFAILIFMFWQNKPTPEEIEAQKAKQELVEEFECLLVTHVCRYLYYALCMCCIADDHVFGDATLKV